MLHNEDRRVEATRSAQVALQLHVSCTNKSTQDASSLLHSLHFSIRTYMRRAAYMNMQKLVGPPAKSNRYKLSRDPNNYYWLAFIRTRPFIYINK